MSRNIFDEAFANLGMDLVLADSISKILDTSHTAELHQKAAELIALSSASAVQQRLDEGTQQLSNIVERDLVTNNLLEEQTLRLTHPRYLEALTLAEKFRLPHLEEAKIVYDHVKESFDARITASFIPRQEELAVLISTLKSPWVNCINPVESFESIAHLASVGKALVPTAYDSLASDTLKSLLGDWSQDTLPSGISSDWRARQQFYFDHGFDRLLTTLPEPTFTESLRETRVLRHDIFPAKSFPTEISKKKRKLNFRALRRRDTYQLLDLLETYLREFIHEKMIALVGPGWEKRRLPADIYEAWQRKRQEAVKKGRKEEKLINYSDFSDYVKIIERSENWREIFEPLFVRKTNAQESFYRLQPLRIDVAHYRVVTKEDYLLVLVESRRILKAIQAIENDDIEEF